MSTSNKRMLKWTHFSCPHLTGCSKGDSSNRANHLEHRVCSKINNLPTGNPLAKATTLIAMAKSAFFARCIITGKNSAVRESKPTNHDWIQMNAHSGPRSRTRAPPLCGTSTSLGLLVLGFSVLSLMEPLRQSTLVIPQIIMSLCAISIVTCNKLSEIVMPFYGGNKTHPRINMTTGNTTFNWLFDTGAAITFMNANSF